MELFECHGQSDGHEQDHAADVHVLRDHGQSDDRDCSDLLHIDLCGLALPDVPYHRRKFFVLALEIYHRNGSDCNLSHVLSHVLCPPGMGLVRRGQNYPVLSSNPSWGVCRPAGGVLPWSFCHSDRNLLVLLLVLHAGGQGEGRPHNLDLCFYPRLDREDVLEIRIQAVGGLKFEMEVLLQEVQELSSGFSSD